MQSKGRGTDRARRIGAESTSGGKDARPPRVLRAFAVYTALAVLLAGLLVVLLVRHNVEANSNQKVAEHAEFVAGAVIPQLLTEDDWSKPLSAEKLAKLDQAVQSELLTNGTLRIKLFSPTGEVIYSTAPQQIGEQASDMGELEEVMEGETETEISQLNGDDGRGEGLKVIEAYTSVKYQGSEVPSGVFELYHDYQEAAGSIRQQALPLTIAVLIVLLLLYLALWPILRRTSRQIEHSNKELRRRAADLNENLVERAEIEDRLRRTIQELEKSENALAHSQEETIMRLSLAVESRDQETGDHIERMGRYTCLLAEKLGWDEERRELLRIAAPLHDVGKIAIPDAILQKPGALTPEERVAIERHAEIGHRILVGSDSPLLELAARIALSHHEHWDGNGYPNQLAGEAIPIEGRMAAIADVFDALTSDRVYRPAMTVERSLAIMSQGRGTHFDPTLLDVFFDSIVEVLMIRDGTSMPDPAQRETQSHRRRRRRARNAAPQAVSSASDEGDQQRSMVG